MPNSSFTRRPRFLPVWLALPIMALSSLCGCGSESAAGGAGGIGASGGTGGAGGIAECQSAVDCDDGAECRKGLCVEPFPCTERGLRDAIVEGGGPHFFSCEGPTTVVTEAELLIGNDVILDGEGLLTIDGNEAHRVVQVGEDVIAELRGLGIRGGAPTSGIGGGLVSFGVLTLVDSQVSANTATQRGGGLVNFGSLELIDTTVSGNASNHGGGIDNDFGELVLTRSTVSGNTAGQDGGGIRNTGTLTMTNSTVSGNLAESAGGGIHNRFDGIVTLTNSTVSGNAADEGGGVCNVDEGTLTFDNVVVSVNSANVGGGISNRAAAIGDSLEVTQTLTSTTVSGNSATQRGGGIANWCTPSVEGFFNRCENEALLPAMALMGSKLSGNTAQEGGAIYNDKASLDLLDTTVSGNSATDGGGVYNSNVDAYGNFTTVTLMSSTVSGNVANGLGGGIYHNGRLSMTNGTVSGNSARAGKSIYSASGQSRLTLTSSTVSAPSGFGTSIHSVAQTVTARGTLVRGGCDGTLESAGGNLESPSNNCGFDQETDQHSVSADALQLGPLADNGGATRTHALLPGSVALDVIPESDCLDATGAPLVIDQRGQPRPETGGTMCDVGAFELQP